MSKSNRGRARSHFTVLLPHLLLVLHHALRPFPELTINRELPFRMPLPAWCSSALTLLISYMARADDPAELLEVSLPARLPTRSLARPPTRPPACPPARLPARSPASPLTRRSPTRCLPTSPSACRLARGRHVPICAQALPEPVLLFTREADVSELDGLAELVVRYALE